MGCNDFGNKKNISRPLSIFTKEDIWTIISQHNIPYCSVYDDQIINGELVKGEERTGCAYCAFGVQYEAKENTRFHRLQKREPKRFNSFMQKLGYKEALALLGLRFNENNGQIEHN